MSYPGVVLPELELLDIVDGAIDRLSATPAPADGIATQMVRALSAERRQDFLTALRTRPGKARLAFSHEAPEDWQVVVMLTGTTERPRTVGVGIGSGDDDVVATTTLASGMTATATAVPLAVVPPGLPVTGRIRIDDELATYRVVSGVVTLVHRGIDGTEAFPHDAGDDVAFSVLVDRIGWEESCKVRCDVLSSNALFGLVLSTCLKGEILAQRGALDARGLTLRSCSETAIAPRPMDWPAQLYTRTLQLDLTRTFTVPDPKPILTNATAQVHLETA